jgi:conjugative transfer signal peptidase TraF
MRYKDFLPLILSFILFLFLIAFTSLKKEKYIFYNYTESLPRGFYIRVPGEEPIKKGDLIAFVPPQTAKKIIDERKYLKPDYYLLKRVIGVPGDSIDTSKDHLIINHRPTGEFLSHDKEGRPISKYSFSGCLKKGEYYTGIPEKKNSFDSRYFGPVSKKNIIGKIRLLLEF